MGARGDIARAYAAGLDAGRQAPPVQQGAAPCPYPLGSLLARAWLRGYVLTRPRPREGAPGGQAAE